jgi:hypothetical protein
MQTDGPSIAGYDLPTTLADSHLVFSPSGLIVTGVTSGHDEQEGVAAGFLLASNGQIDLLYEELPAATPVASPVGSPVGSPLASPVASPASPSPEAVTTGG